MFRMISLTSHTDVLAASSVRIAPGPKEVLRFPGSPQVHYRGTPAGWAAHTGHKEARDLILGGLIDIVGAIHLRHAPCWKKTHSAKPG